MSSTHVPVVILCGGKGTRLREQTEEIPKPMVHIGGMPILWHIMKGYAHYGFRDFILCLGYKAEKIKEFFLNFEWQRSDFTLDWGTHERHLHYKDPIENWKITFAETGAETNTGGRVKKIEKYIHGDTFFLTYGDGLSDINYTKQLEYHRKHKKIGTMTCVRPKSQFGIVEIGADQAVLNYAEKPKSTQWVNGGFFIFNKPIFKLIEENDILETKPLEKLASKKQLIAYKFDRFWACMDTYKDTQVLNDLWKGNQAPWKTWEQ